MKQLDWNLLDADGRVAALARAPQTCSPKLHDGVADIIAHVRAQGDAALRALSARYDGCALDAIEVGHEEFAAAEAILDAELKDAIREAADRIEKYHRATALRPQGLDTASGVRVERILRPIDRVGLYVPAGTAPLPSTALMLGIPARIAGCSQVVMCSPARADGRCDAAVLFAARLTGVHRVFRIGGAQAVAAMAYGTASVPRNDKLFGPGNAWVTEAKLQVSMDPAGAAIDMPAGPSEVMVIADANANPVYVAADMLSQAEHGVDSQAILVTPSPALLGAVQSEIARQCVDLPRLQIIRQALEHSRLILVDSNGQALEVANAYAPEHLVVQVEAPRTLLDGIRNAGSVFLGPWAPESVGDYCSGGNHVLPTYGNARTFSGLSVLSYQKQITVQELSAQGLRNIGACTATLAAAERLEAHRRAVTLRMTDLEHDTAADAGTSGASLSVLDLAREDLRALQPYSSARMEACGGAVLLNANESAWAPAGDNGVHCNRYPEPQPVRLVAELADLYQVDREQLLITRGSDSAIDLLVRAFCTAGADAVLIQPPTFGMYAVSAQIQGASVIAVPLANDFGVDVDAVLAALAPAVKLVFVCAPNNPTGQGVPRDELRRLATALTGRAMLVVDEAYVEFADVPSVADLLDRHEHLVVLRTLSKAWALAGARIGSVLAHREVVSLLARIMSPYPLGRPGVEAALRTLSADGRERTRDRIGVIRAERIRMADELRGLVCVRDVLPSQANFLTVRFLDAEVAFQRLLGAGIVVRDVRHYPGLADSLRITIGTPMENDLVLAALGEIVPCT